MQINRDLNIKKLEKTLKTFLSPMWTFYKYRNDMLFF